MTPEKKTDQAPKPSATAAEGGRKAWIPKTPVEVVLEQIGKQETQGRRAASRTRRREIHADQTAPGEESPGGNLALYHRSLLNEGSVFYGGMPYGWIIDCRIGLNRSSDRSRSSRSLWSRWER